MGINVKIAQDMPYLFANKVQLQQVFSNFIGNAIKHHCSNTGQVEISVKDNGDFYEFTVADDGPGISPLYHEKIFEMFQTLHPRDEVESTGVGLALVKKIVGSVGGIVSLESEEGKGAIFHFSWPKQYKD